MSVSPVTSIEHTRAGLARITVAALLWGTTGVVVQHLHTRYGLDPIAIAFYRLALAAGFLALMDGVRRAVLPAGRRPSSEFYPRAGTRLGLVLVGACLGAYQALYFVAVTLAGVGVATVIGLGLAPVLTACWEAGRSRVRPAPLFALTLLAGVVGLVLVALSPSSVSSSGSSGSSGSSVWLGVAAATLSGVVYAVSATLSRHVAQTVPSSTLTLGSTFVGAVCLVPFASGLAAAFDSAVAVALLCFLGIVTTAVAYALFYAGLRWVRSSAASLTTLLEPVAAALLAVALLGEQLRPAAIVGGVLLLCSVGVLYLRP